MVWRGRQKADLANELAVGLRASASEYETVPSG